MRAVTWHGKRDVRVEDVPDPEIIDPTDVIIRVTSTGICGSDLHLYEVLGVFLDAGDILPLLTDDDPLGTEDFATHRPSLEDAPDAYSTFQKKEDGAIKILLQP